MLKNTFCHIPGIGARLERRLWESGVRSWEGSFETPFEHGSNPTEDAFRALVKESLERLEECDSAWFAAQLPAREHWRLFPEFRRSTAYLDIETNGFMGPRGYITAITLYDGSSVHTYVRGKNLDNFKRDAKRYSVFVTYNGKCFDMPFIESHLGVDMRGAAHIDLRFVLRDLGFRGGLKGCEKALGIDRGELDGVDGYTAVLLWRDFRRNGNEKALETLLAYNILDAVNLEPLAVIAYNLMIERTPFSQSHRISMPESPEALPYKPDARTVERILFKQNRNVSEAVS